MSLYSHPDGDKNLLRAWAENDSGLQYTVDKLSSPRDLCRHIWTSQPSICNNWFYHRIQGYKIIIEQKTRMQQRLYESVCCLQQTNSSSSHQLPSNWVDTIIPSCSSSQSAELSAESGHMSYLGSCVFFFFFFFSYHPRVRIQEAEP